MYIIKYIVIVLVNLFWDIYLEELLFLMCNFFLCYVVCMMVYCVWIGFCYWSFSIVYIVYYMWIEWNYWGIVKRWYIICIIKRVNGWEISMIIVMFIEVGIFDFYIWNLRKIGWWGEINLYVFYYCELYWLIFWRSLFWCVWIFLMDL